MSLLIPAQLLTPRELTFDPSERERLRTLAVRVAGLAALPIQAEKRALWRAHNQLQPTRPVIFCDPENSWHEIIPNEQLTCSHTMAREWEFRLLREIFWGEQMGDDRPIEATFDVGIPHEEPFWGLRERRIGGEAGGAYTWEAPLRSEDDLARLHLPTMTVDYHAADQLEDTARGIFSGLLTVRRRTSWWWTTGMTWTLVNLRGLEQMLFDMSDNPAFLHRLMTLLCDGTLALSEELERAGLLAPNWDGGYVGSGALGYTDELPAPGYTGTPRLRDLWVLGESQETVGVSPRMFSEFIWPYQRVVLARFGLACYGCCEAIDSRWKVIRELPNLRRVSISPWANREKMADALQDRYIYSLKPNPADLAMESFDLERVRSELRRDLEVTSGCRVEVVMKDNHTIRRDPRRILEWVRMAREESENLGMAAALRGLARPKSGDLAPTAPLSPEEPARRPKGTAPLPEEPHP